MAVLLMQGECTAHVTTGNALSANDVRANPDLVDGFTTPAARQGQYKLSDNTVSFYPIEAAPSAAGVLWFHARVEADSSSYATFLFNSVLDPDIQITVGGPDDRVQVDVGSTVVSQTGHTPDSTFNIDVELATATGNWVVYVNEVVVVSGTGHSGIQALDLTTITQMFLGGGASFSEAVVTQDESTVGCRVLTLNPDAEGTDTDMTGTLTDINNNGFTAAGYTITGAGSQSFLYDDVDAAFTTDYVIKAVSVDTVVSAASDAVAPNAEITVNGVVEGAAEALDPSSTETTVTRIMELNPADAEAWDFSDLVGIEFGVDFSI